MLSVPHEPSERATPIQSSDSRVAGRSSPYADAGFAVIRQLVGAETLDLLSLYLALRHRLGDLDADMQVRESASTYGDPAFDALLAQLTSRVAAIGGLELLPTYSFVRVYRSGGRLAPHTDRSACEHSLTIHLASSDGQAWPIWIQALDGSAVQIDLCPGDAVMYRGCDLAHWRDACPSSWYAQAFLHYIDGAGPNANQVFDGRCDLGTAKVHHGAPNK